MDFKVPLKQNFKIGEVCEMMEVATHTLRYWEMEFEELRPEKNPMGQRVYTPRDIEMIHVIKRLLYEEGYTIEGARKQLKREIAKLDGGPSIDTKDIREHLGKLRAELRQILTLLDRNVK